MKKRKYLSEEERNLPTREIQEKFGLPRACAWRAKTRAWFVPGYQQPGHYEGGALPEPLPPRTESRVEGAIILSDEERMMSALEISKKFGISCPQAGMDRSPAPRAGKKDFGRRGPPAGRLVG